MRRKVIAFIGTDGSGKTTIMNAVLPHLEALLACRFRIQHLKPDLLPPLGQLRGVKHESGYICTDPHGSRPSGFIGSLVRLIYLTMDYVLGYWFRVRRVVRRLDCAGWVFDRYAYDMLIDPVRFRIRLPLSVIRWALRIIPKPDVVICLGGDPAKIHARKPETSEQEVARQVSVLRRFCAADKRMHWIDTTCALESSVKETLDILKRVCVHHETA